MLAANVSAADLLERHKHPGLYRVHEGPTPDRLANLRALLKTLGLQLDGGDAPQPAHYAALIARIRTRPDRQLLQTVLLRSMQQAVYSPYNAGHFGLAFTAYAHFTSPIRRYPDLLVHRAIKAILSRRTFVPTLAEVELPVVPVRASPRPARKKAEEGSVLAIWERLGLLCSANERRADDASRDVEAWLKSYYMRERVGETYSGSISAVVPFGIFVVLDDLFVEGLVHVSELGSEYFHFNEALHELRGERTGQRYRLADRLTVQVSRVDLEGRRIEFRLVRASDRKALLATAGQPEVLRKPPHKGESVEERQARRAVVAARKSRDIDKRETARVGGKVGLGGSRVGKTRRRGRR